MAQATDDYTTVLARVESWPLHTRLAFAQDVLRSLGRELPPGSQPPRRSLRALLGLLHVPGPAPSDEECRRMLEEELLRKYGP
jgi:hypothetical protein